MDRIILFFCLIFLNITTFARDPLSPEEISYIINEFQFDVVYKEVSSQKNGGSWDSCWIYKKRINVEYPNMTEPLQLTVSYYIPNRDRLGDTRLPMVVMLPPTGGMNLLDRRMADSFCDEKIVSAIIEDDFANIVYQAQQKLLPPEDHERSYYRAVAGVKAMMAFGANDPNVQSDKIGVFGVSLGGILGAFVMSTQAQISAGYMIVAGGDVPYILAQSQQEDVSAIRRKRMNEQGFKDRIEYENFLRNYISIDPMDIASTMLPETLRMVIARRDKTVPTANQLALHKAYGEPEAVYYNQDHVDTVIDALFLSSSRARVTRFFKARFELDNPRPLGFEFYKQLYLASQLN